MWYGYLMGGGAADGMVMTLEEPIARISYRHLLDSPEMYWYEVIHLSETPQIIYYRYIGEDEATEIPALA